MMPYKHLDLGSTLVPPAGLEPTHPASEAGALSTELQGRRLQIYHNDISEQAPQRIDTALQKTPSHVDNPSRPSI